MAAQRTSQRSLTTGLLFTALLLLAGVLSTAASADGARLGQTARSPSPSCPKDPCQAVGRTTVVQLVADGRRGVFKAKEDGKVVAWALSLSGPNQTQREFFGEFYASETLGMRPTARIAVVKRKGEGREYKLKGQSAVVDLTTSLDSYQVFTLNDPLRIRKGEFLALTIPTWSPSFAIELNRTSNIWRASRTEAEGKCDSERTIKNGKPQQKVGSTRTYDCDYSTARVLYWGFYEPKKN